MAPPIVRIRTRDPSVHLQQARGAYTILHAGMVELSKAFSACLSVAELQEVVADATVATFAKVATARLYCYDDEAVSPRPNAVNPIVPFSTL